MSSEKFHLDNPPIKEVALALCIDSAKYDIDFIEKFKQENLKDFPNVAPFQSVNIKIKNNDEIQVDSVNKFNAYTLTNEANDELWNIDLNRILFADKTKYVSFDTFLDKFLKKYNLIYSLLNEDFNVKLIALRYSNEFAFKIQDLNNNFAILPLFQQQYKGELYASNASHLSVANVIDIGNSNINAMVNTMFKVNPMNTSELLINFDIEVKYSIENKINLNVENLTNLLSEMRIFKNKIFFSNVLKANEVFNNDSNL